MKDTIGTLVATIWFIGGPLTFIYLTFFDNYAYTAWNWIIVVPMNAILSSIWPIYWAVLHWVF